MSRYIKVLFCLLSSLFCSCSFSSEQNIYDVQTTDYGLIYGISNCVYKDYKGTFDFESVFEEHLKDVYPDADDAFFINCCSTKNNNIYMCSTINVDDSNIYSFDLVTKDTKVVQHIGSINQKDVINKFSLSDETYLLNASFNCRVGLLDDNNPDFLLSVLGKSVYDRFDVEIVFDKDTFELLVFEEKNDSINEEDVCLRRTGATIISIERNGVYIPALKIDDKIYTFEDDYLSKNCDYFPTIKSPIFARSHLSNKFLRIENSIFLVLIPFSDDFTELDNLIYKIDIKQKFAHYIGFIPKYNNLKGVVML